MDVSRFIYDRYSGKRRLWEGDETLCSIDEGSLVLEHHQDVSEVVDKMPIVLDVLCRYRSIQEPDFWARVKPSTMINRPGWMTFDDLWVDEVTRGVRACTVFCWYPLYCICPK